MSISTNEINIIIGSWGSYNECIELVFSISALTVEHSNGRGFGIIDVNYSCPVRPKLTENLRAVEDILAFVVPRELKLSGMGQYFKLLFLLPKPFFYYFVLSTKSAIWIPKNNTM